MRLLILGDTRFLGRHLAEQALAVRPHDRTGRLGWWTNRLRRGGDVPAPGPSDTPVP